MLLVLLSYFAGCKRLVSRDYLDRNYAKASDILFARNENGQIILKDAGTVSFGAINENEHILQLVGYGPKTSFVKMSDQNIQFEIKNNNEKLYILTAFSTQNGDYFDNEIIQAVNKDSGKIETRVNNLTDSSGEKYLLATSETFTSLVERVAAVENSLSTKIQILERNITILNNQNAQLEKSVNDLNSQNSELEINIENLNSQNSELEESAKRLNYENSELKNDVNMLRSEASKWESMYYSAIKTPTSKPATPTPNTPKPVTYTASKEPDTPTPEPLIVTNFTLDVDETGKILIVKWDGYAQNRISTIQLSFDVHSINNNVGNVVFNKGNLENNDNIFVDVLLGQAMPPLFCQSEYCFASVWVELSRNLGESFIKINATDKFNDCSNDRFMCPSEGQSVNERFEVCPCKRTTNKDSYIIFVE